MRLLVLANSKKFNGRCIAGIDLDSGNWIRPVSKTEHGEFTGAECSITVGGSRRQVQSLDVIEVVVGSSKPGVGHPEDIQTNHGNWKHLTSISIEEAEEIKRTREMLNGILAKHSGQTIAKIGTDTERDNFMTAKEAKAYGLLDDVLVKRPVPAKK